MKNFIYVFIASAIFIFGCTKSDDTIITPSIDNNRYPNAPASPSPSNGAVNVSGFITLQWSCTDPDAGDTLRYDVRYGLTSTPTDLLVTNTLNPAADLGIADTNKTIFWKVTAKDNHGLTKEGPTWSFTTAH